MNLAPVQLSPETRALATVNRWMGTLHPYRQKALRSDMASLVAEVRASIEGRDLIRVAEKPAPPRKAVAR
jgi:hypothetical protein